MEYKFEFEEIKNCGGCPFMNDAYTRGKWCNLDNDLKITFDEDMPEWCPLLEYNSEVV